MRELFNKLKIPVAGLLLAVGVLFSVNGLVSEAGARDCSSNAVIRCGVTSMGELRDKYAKDYTKGTQNIFSHFGINSNMLNNYSYKRGIAYNNGDVYVGNKKVATGAHSAGREYQPGSTKHTVNGTTFYKRPLHVWNQKTWDVFVFTDKNGRFVAAVMLICGNPVSAKPVEPPKPPAPKPAYYCGSVSRIKQSDPNKYIFRAKSAAEHGAKATGFTIEFGDGNSQRVNVQRTEGKHAFADVPYTYTKPGTYNVKLTAHFTVNGKTVSHTAERCLKPVTIPKKEVPPAPKKPAVSIDKQVRADEGTGMTKEEALEQARNFTPKGNCTTVMTPAIHVETGAKYTFTSGCLPKGWVAERNFDGQVGSTDRKTTQWQEHVKVAVNEEFDYRLVVKNTGDVTLKNARVTDPAPNGVTFVRADKGQISGNAWTYTVPELKPGQSITFIIQAKVTKYQSGKIVNTACVDAKEVPGDKDDCDDATVEVEKPPVTPPAPEPEPEMVKVCDTKTGEIVEVSEEQAKDDRYAPVDSDKCKEDEPEPQPEPEPEMVKVCDTKTGEIVQVTEEQAKSDRYADVDSDKCKEEEPELPTELPQTGLGLALNGLAGIGTLTAAGYYYVSSRRF